MKFLRIFVWLCVGLFSLYGICESANETWSHIKDEHFIVYYSVKGDSSEARKILNAAESYYHRIAYQLGYARYAKFWTWDERAKIIIFPNQKTFMNYTGQPEWSRGYADRYSSLFRSRVVITYRQEKDFLHGLLPHEISHLILWDFIGFNKSIPIWFDEGVAQLHESNKRITVNDIMRVAVKEGRYIPFDIFMNYDIQSEEDLRKASAFYSQSVSVVDFLVKQYGNNSFGELCRNLKEGRGMEEALRVTYYPSIRSMKDLENKWVYYMKR